MQNARKKTVRLSDIARRVGCSPTIVSVVINGAMSNSGVSEKLARRVRQTADEMDYQPNFASQSLARRSTRTIGIYVPKESPGAGIAYGYESTILRGVERACQEQGYDWLAINLLGQNSPKTCREKFLQQRIDGLLLLHVEDDADWVELLASDNVNIATINYYGPVRSISIINFDEVQAMHLAVTHLVELAHREIGYWGPSEDMGLAVRGRLDAFRRAAQDNGLTINEAFIFSNSDDIGRFQDSAVKGAAYFAALAESRYPTAIVCYDDYLALMGMGELQDAGIRIPEQISLVGVDNVEAGQLVRPRLTTIAQPLASMGYRATRHLINTSQARQKEKDFSPKPFFEKALPELIVRQSSAPPRRKPKDLR